MLSLLLLLLILCCKLQQVIKLYCNIIVGTFEYQFGFDKSQFDQYYMSFLQRTSIGVRSRCYLNNHTYQLWRGKVTQETSQYYWKNGDICDLCIDYQFIKHSNMSDQNKHQFKGSIFWRKDGTIIKRTGGKNKTWPQHMKTNENGNICLDFEKYYYMVMFSNTTNHVDSPNRCIVDVTTIHQTISDIY